MIHVMKNPYYEWIYATTSKENSKVGKVMKNYKFYNDLQPDQI